MHQRFKKATARITVLAVLLLAFPAGVAQASAGARLEGLLIDIDGRPASGFSVHLIDRQGKAVARTEANGDGLYSFRDLPEGAYSLGIENHQGQMAPVASAPIKLSRARIVRRDVKLLQAGPENRQQVTTANYGLGSWWAGLTGASKAWVIVGIVAVAGITVAAVTDDSSSNPPEPPASP